MAIGTTNYPTSLDTAVELVEAANQAADTLNGGINSSITALTVNDASKFANSGIVLIDSEYIAYGSRTSTVLQSLVRGFESSTAATHASGAAVRQVITATSNNVKSAAIIALETKLGIGTDIAWGQMAPLTASRMVASDGAGDVTASPLTHNATDALIGNVGGLDFNTTPTAANAAARLIWDDTDGTLDLSLKGGNVTVPLAQKEIARVVNKTGSNLLGSNYQVVRISTAQGQRLGIGLAQANSEPNSTDILGLISENITNNQEGFVTTRGLITDINTTGSLQGETWADGNILYLSPGTAGGLTTTEPQAPNHLVIIGYVVYAHATQGKIFVAIQTSWETKELHDVKITGTPSAGQLMIRNATINVWENASLTAGSGISITNADKSITISSTGGGSGDVVGPSGATDSAIARFDGSTGKLIKDSNVAIDVSGSFSWPDGVRQAFNPNGTNAGINVGAHTSDPANLTNGDLWYNSTVNQLKTRRGAVTQVVATVPATSTANREIPTINPSTGNLDNMSEMFYISADNALKVGDVGTGKLQLSAITTETPSISAIGVDTNISLNLVSKGTGTVQVNSVPVVTTTGSQALTNKTINAGVNTITNVSLSSAVTGTLPIANGGTGQVTQQAAITALVGSVPSGYYLRGNGSNAVMSALQATDVSGTLPVTSGGTGAATLTANNVLLGNGASAVQVVAPGTSGNMLTSNGTTWTSMSQDGDKGDITVSANNTMWTIDNGVIVDAKVNASAAIDSSKLASDVTTDTKTQTLTNKTLAAASIGTAGSCTVDGTSEVGYRVIPQNSQSAAYTLTASDAGKQIYHPLADATPRTYTIPGNSSVPYPIGTAITFANDSASAVTIAISSDVLALAGTGATGSRALAQYGIATAVKVTSTRWIISGIGLT